MKVDNIVAANKRRAKHGMYRTRAYQVWQQMKDRCHNPNNARFHRYGGRGISVCTRWHVFNVFYADMGDPPVGMTLDRIDNNGNYEPANCRWSTRKQQQNNISSNTQITYCGKTQTLAQWANELGIPYSRLVYRHVRGWQPPELFSQDNRRGTTTKHMVEYEGEYITLKELSRRSGVNLKTLYYRLRVGRPLI